MADVLKHANAEEMIPRVKSETCYYMPDSWLCCAASANTSSGVFPFSFIRQTPTFGVGYLCDV